MGNYLLPINLATMGVPRMTTDGTADLETIWKTPYPVITNYKKLCNDVRFLKPFGGSQHEVIDLHSRKWSIEQTREVLGYITSGYRDKVLNGNKQSAHLYGFAIDIFVGNINDQIIVGEKALKYYNRIGLYPDNNFIHLDMAPPNWIEKYDKTLYWVTKNNMTKGFNDFNDATKFALAA